MAYQPKSYRKFLVGAVSTAVVASSFAGVAGAAANFTDVNANYKEAVDFLVSKGINGTSATTFGTYDQITRLDAAIFVAKALELDVDNAADAGFKDVPANRAKYVNALKAAKITAGKSTDSFGAYDLITRGELAKWLVTGFGLKGSADISAFNDVPANYADAVKTLVSNKITSGTSATTFGTYDNAKRGDFAVFVKKSADVPKEEVVVGELTVQSASVINSKQLEIKFSKPVDKSTVVATGDVVGTSDISITPIDNAASISLSTAKSKLSDDGKTLTITAAGSEYFDKNYTLVVGEGITTETGEELTKYTTTVEAKDTTRPALVKTSYSHNGTNPVAVLEFSEPIDMTNATFEYERADGEDLDSSTTFNQQVVSSDVDNKKIEIELNAVQAVDQNKDIKVKVVGVADYKQNVITPNPSQTTIKYNTTDVKGPEVQTVTVKNNTTLEVKFNEPLSTVFTGNEFTLNGTASNAITKDEDDDTLYKIEWSSAFANGPQTLVIPSVNDIWSQSTASKNKLVNVSIDTTAPALQNSKVEKINGVEFLVLTYSENVEPQTGVAIDGTYVKNNVTYTTSATSQTITTSSTNFVKHNAVDNKSKQLKLKLTDLTEDGVSYKLTLPLGLVKDVNGNNAPKVDVTFTRGENSSTGKPELDTTVDSDNGIKQDTSNNNKLEVYFKNAVDATTALNKANYSIDGASIDNVTLTQNNSSGAVVVVEFVKDSLKNSGLTQITVSGVKGQTGVQMDAVTTAETLVENVRPTVTKAELTGANEVTLTFSEAMDGATIDTGDGDEFDIFLGNVKYTAGTVKAAAGSDNKKVVITLGTGLTASDLQQTITVKEASAFEIKDLNGNKANFASSTVTIN
ncbi:S-layer homology domain-containing protein [Bacillus benzoevorans]|uniref:Nitrogen regulatory protein PII n=1 Tax=Bacillus benzoevorans TaxID=1456 RepID=A0A7X0HUD6_9BACI|nr:S-layer homology domain-containing protein [Bacillus benzoevorans]MBB6446072.1 nitrogen regulatory protein PII [Bacillus benzoevorans]